MESISKHWHVAIYVVGLIFMGGMVVAENGAQEEKIDKNTEQIEMENQEVNEIKERVIRVEEEQQHQGENIDEIKGDVKEILKELREKK